jgi:hypothetical protein
MSTGIVEEVHYGHDRRYPLWSVICMRSPDFASVQSEGESREQALAENSGNVRSPRSPESPDFLATATNGKR